MSRRLSSNRRAQGLLLLGLLAGALPGVSLLSNALAGNPIPPSQTALASTTLTSGTDQENCFAWPLRQRAGNWAYDGDTVYISMPGLPKELSAMSVRLIGLDTPEKGHRAQCEAEKKQAEEARAFLESHMHQAETLAFCNPKWGKYAGRVLADLRLDGQSARELLIAAGLARPYDGGKREGWCE